MWSGVKAEADEAESGVKRYTWDYEVLPCVYMYPVKRVSTM